jgi:hypothetical protein
MPIASYGEVHYRSGKLFVVTFCVGAPKLSLGGLVPAPFFGARQRLLLWLNLVLVWLGLRPRESASEGICWPLKTRLPSLRWRVLPPAHGKQPYGRAADEQRQHSGHRDKDGEATSVG